MKTETIQIKMPYEVTETVVVQGRILYNIDLICPQPGEVDTAVETVDIDPMVNGLVKKEYQLNWFPIPHGITFSGKLETLQDLIDAFDNDYKLSKDSRLKLSTIINSFNQKLPLALDGVSRGVNTSGDFIGWVKK